MNKALVLTMHDGDQVLVEGLTDENDPDIIIPKRLSVYLVYSAHLLLVTSALSLAYAIKFHWTVLFGVAALCFFLYGTSIWHWREPRFSSLVRRLDYCAVFGSLALASYVATTLSGTWIILWFVGLGTIGTIFATNEFLYYHQVMRRVDGGTSDAEGACCSGSFRPTAPCTEERERVYVRTTFVHLVCVHVLANALAMALIIGGETSRDP